MQTSVAGEISTDGDLGASVRQALVDRVLPYLDEVRRRARGVGRGREEGGGLGMCAMVEGREARGLARARRLDKGWCKGVQRAT